MYKTRINTWLTLKKPLYTLKADLFIAFINQTKCILRDKFLSDQHHNMFA